MGKRRLPRWMRVLILVLILLLPLAGGVAIFLVLNKPSVAEMGSYPLPFAPADTIIPLSDTMLVCDRSFLYSYMKNGTKRWDYPLEFQDARCSATEQNVAVWSGKSLRLLDNEGRLIFGGSMAQDIEEVRCGNSMFALLSADGVISVFDASGATLDTIEQPDVTVLDFAFYNQGNMLWVLSLEASGASPVSHISTYQPSRLMTSGNKYPDQIIYRALFHQNDIAYVGSRTLYQNAEGGAQGKTTETLVYGWELIDNGVNRERIAMLFAPATQIADGKLDRVKYIYGATIEEIKTEPDCFDAKLGQKGIYLFSRERIMFRSYTGETRTLASPVPIDDVLALFSDDSMLISHGTSLYIITQ